MKHLEFVEHVVIHCSDSSWGEVDEIRAWHTRPKPPNELERTTHPHKYGNGWSDVGYHWVVCNGRPRFENRPPHPIVEAWDGMIERGRNEAYEGAHAPDYNHNSIAVCLVGRKDSFTPRQVARAAALAAAIIRQYPGAKVIGHCETKSGQKQGKTCPELDMNVFRSRVEVGHWLGEIETRYQNLRSAVAS